MKFRVIKMFFAALVAIAAVSAQAATETVNGITWTYTVSSGKASIGGGSSSSLAVPESTSGAITIPSTLGGCPVARIGNYAFYECSSLTSVTIPDSVTSIGDYAFDDCSSLTSVTIGKSVTSIGKCAFYNCSSLTSVTIPDSVTSIGEYAFYDCSSLTSITILNSVTSIGSSAFRGCSGLADSNGFVIVKGVLHGYFGEGGYVVIPNGITRIGDRAFNLCVSLTNVVIPPSVRSIGSDAFSGCYDIKHLTISNYLLQLYGIKLFPSYRSIEKLIITGQSKDLETAESKIVLNCGFNDCASLKDVEIGEGLVGMDGTFERCSSLENVKLPSSLVWIEDAFYLAGSLKSVVFSGDAPEVSADAFYGTPRRLVFSAPEGSIGWNGGISEGIPTTWMDRQVVSYVPENQPGSGQNPSVPGDDITKPTENSYFLTVTNVVVHYVLNSVQSEIALPVGDSTGYVNVITEVTSGGAVCVPTEWKDNFEGFDDKFGSDFGKALMKPTGKVDGAGNAMLVWQDYVAGTNPMNPDDKFVASVTIVDGKPIVSWSPELPEEQAALRSYTIYGKTKLQDSKWSKVNGDEENYNFFKVVVEMK